MQNWPRWRKRVFPGSFQAHFCARCGEQIRTFQRPLLECRSGRTGERRLRNDRHLVPVVRKTTHALPVPAILLGRDQKNPLLPTAEEPCGVEHDSALPCWLPDVVRHWYPCVAALGRHQCRFQPVRSTLRPMMPKICPARRVSYRRGLVHSGYRGCDSRGDSSHTLHDLQSRPFRFGQFRFHVCFWS